MSETAKFTISILILVLAGFIMPWWLIPIGIGLAAFWFGLSPIKAGILAMGTTSSLWIALCLFRDFGAEVSIAGILSSLLGNISNSAIYTLVGLVIGLVSSLFAVAGASFRPIIYPQKA